MGKESIVYGDIEIEKRKFYHSKNLIFLKSKDIDNIQLSRKVSSGEKNYKSFISLYRL